MLSVNNLVGFGARRLLTPSTLAFDAFSVRVTTFGAAKTWTHTPVGTPKGVLILINLVNNATFPTMSAVTYGGVALTQVPGSPLTKSTGQAGGVSVWFLGSGIPTGAQTCSVTGSGSANYHPHCITVTAAGDTVVQDTKTISSDSVANPSVNLSLGGFNCFCALSFVSGQIDVSGISPNAGWTGRNEADQGAFTDAVYSYDTIGTADVAAGWTQTAEDAIAMAIAIKDA